MIVFPLGVWIYYYVSHGTSMLVDMFPTILSIPLGPKDCVAVSPSFVISISKQAYCSDGIGDG